MSDHLDPAERDIDCPSHCTDAESVYRWYHRQVARMQMEHHERRTRQISSATEQFRMTCSEQQLPEEMITMLVEHFAAGEQARLHEERLGRMAVLQSVCRGRIAALTNATDSTPPQAFES